MTLTAASAFSGIGGIDRGLEEAGIEVVWQCEIDKAAQKVLRAHWPDMPLHDDIRVIHSLNECPDGGCSSCVPTVDVLAGGSPCTDWSVAGRRAGLAGSRTGVFFDFVALADSLAPRWFLFENVPGLLSACSCSSCAAPASTDEDDEEEVANKVKPEHRGRDFAIVLAEITGFHPAVPKGGWRSVGICGGPKRAAAWRVYDSQWYGVAQRRKRVHLVAVRDPLDRSGPAEVLSVFESLQGHPAPRRTSRPDTASDAQRGIGADGLPDVVQSLTRSFGGGGPDDNRAQGGFYIPEVAPALTAKMAKGTGGPAGDEVQNLIAEPAGQAFSTKLHNTNSNQAGKFYEEYAPGLQANSPPPAVVYPIDMRNAGRESGTGAGTQGSGIGEDGDPSPSLTGNSMGRPAVAYSVVPETGQGSDLRASEVDLAPTLTATAEAESSDRGLFIAAYRKVQKAHHPEDGERWEEEGDCFDTLTGHGVVAASVIARAPDLQVRRLMPIECLRLMGLPDDWLDLPGLTDSARYRLIGNSVAVPVITHIAERMVEVAGRTA